MAAKKPAAKAAAKKDTKTTQAKASASKEKSLNELAGALSERAGVTKV